MPRSRNDVVDSSRPSSCALSSRNSTSFVEASESSNHAVPVSVGSCAWFAISVVYRASQLFFAAKVLVGYMFVPLLYRLLRFCLGGRYVLFLRAELGRLEVRWLRHVGERGCYSILVTVGWMVGWWGCYLVKLPQNQLL